MIKTLNEILITDIESRTCLIDGKIFESNRKMIWHVRKTYGLSFEEYVIKYYYNDVRPICLKTGNPLSFKANKLGPWFANYSKNNHPRTTHSEETKKKIKDGCRRTSIEKFGVSNVFETDWCKDKIKSTLIKKYGADNIMKTPSHRERMAGNTLSRDNSKKGISTSLMKFGVAHYSKGDDHKFDIRKRGFVNFYKDWDDYLYKLRENKLNRISCIDGNIDTINENKLLRFKCNVCNTEWEDIILMPDCIKCNDEFRNVRSKEEHHLLKWLSENTQLSDIEHNKRLNVDGKVYEADIKIESKKVIIEFNGLYWHSEVGGGKDRLYHLNKLNAFNSLGYSVIQIFEDEWIYNTDIIKSKILHKLGYNNNRVVYAKNCIIKEISNRECNTFLEQTHIQGWINAKVCYGAYYNDELVSVMTFSLPRISVGTYTKQSKDTFELVRFSTSINHRVVGIFSRLLKHFTKSKYVPNQIITYADKRFSDGGVYIKNGFSLVKHTDPNYWYVKKYKREHRFNYTKQKLINDGYDPNLSEKEIMLSRGFDRIWDCGHFKFEWNRIS